MLSIQRGLILLSAIGAVAVPMVMQTPSGVIVADGPPDPKQLYSKSDPEYYLTSEKLIFVRPGLNITVQEVQIPADRRPVVEVTFTDDRNQPLDRAGILTPGAISASFVLAWYDAELRDYVSYTVRTQTSPITGDSAIQASADSGGAWTDLEMGRAVYTFRTALPADFDGSRTHTLGIYATRNLVEILGTSYYANVEHDFRPDGGQVTEVWNAVADETCNSCHEQLAFHGGSRRNVKLCMLCHNKQTWDPDTGNTVDMKVMIHKIHRGADLPSVLAGIPYQLIGFQQTVHDYSHVVFPQDIRNCTRCHDAGSPEGHIWYSRPNRDACGSCHDDIDWVTGENHVAGPQASDVACANCHRPQGEREFDASVMGAHTIPTRSSQLAGLHMEILEVRGAEPGGTPTVDFRVTNGDGTFVEPSSLNSLNLLVGGPTTDFDRYFRGDARGAAVSGDVATYTFTTPLPDDATGTWAFSADCYRNVTIDDGGAGISLREAAFNPLYYAAVTDDEPVVRRAVVSMDKCNVCHDVLSLHGGQRFRLEECLICHHANETDRNRRPGAELPPESVHMKWMIHRIHAGNTLENDFTVYGFGGTPHNYNHVGYPGDLRTCVGCHLEETYGVPLPDGVLPTITERDYYSPYQPAAAACNSCHSSVDAAAHAWVNTAPFGESCAACHGDNREFSVDRVHAH